MPPWPRLRWVRSAARCAMNGGATRKLRPSEIRALARAAPRSGHTAAKSRAGVLTCMRQDGVMQQPRDFSMAGAVDLGARQAAAKRRDQASQAPGTGGDSGFVFDATDATFNTDVIGRSQAAPVIVDLWAQWCESCKQLSPVLERLANEAAGDWLLAKVDVDANPQLSAALQVQSIPMVVAVIGGQLVDGFLGALPEAQVKQWINQILQVADQLGMPARVRAEASATGSAHAQEAANAGRQGAAGEAAGVPGAP